MILVTGSNGIIGSYLTALLPDTDGIDIEDAKELSKSIHKGILHFGAMSRVSVCKKEPIKCAHYNITNTLQLLEFCRVSGAWMVFASSRGVAKMDSLYAITKHTCELLCYRYAQDYGLKIMILRLGDVMEIGSNKAYATIYRAVRDNKPPRITNTTEQFDFITLNDVYNAVTYSMEKLQRVKGPFCERIEVTSGKLTTLPELVEELKHAKQDSHS